MEPIMPHEIRPTIETECEVCNYEGPDCKLFDQIVMCPSCLSKAIHEYNAEQEVQKAAIIGAKIEHGNTFNRRREDKILTGREYHVKWTESILSIRQKIDADISITSKDYTE